MLSLATSRSKTPSAQRSDPNIRLGFGETAARRSFFFACGIWRMSTSALNDGTHFGGCLSPSGSNGHAAAEVRGPHRRE